MYSSSANRLGSFQFTPKGCTLLPVETDADGMIPDALRRVLSRWKPGDARDPGSDVPRLLYTIPNGVNPTGTSLTTDRRRQIYEVPRHCVLFLVPKWETVCVKQIFFCMVSDSSGVRHFDHGGRSVFLHTVH